MTKLTVILVLSITISSSWAYPTGAPPSSCDDMAPQHDHLPQDSELPYTVSVSSNEVKPGEAVDITITGKNFKGYFVQVRKDDKAQGQFDTQSTNTVDCHNTKNSAATHSDREDKDSVKLKWIAPENPGEYTVYVTIVENFKTFWEKRPTEKITVK